MLVTVEKERTRKKKHALTELSAGLGTSRLDFDTDVRIFLLSLLRYRSISGSNHGGWPVVTLCAYNSEAIMSTFRPNAGIAQACRKSANATKLSASRSMEWVIAGEKVTYTCSCCSWKFVVELGLCSEPFRLFNQHRCESQYAEIVP